MPEIKVYNTKKGRRYLIEETEYISVTTPLNLVSSSELNRWRGAVGVTKAKFFTKKAIRRGNRLHDVCEAIACGLEPAPPRNSREGTEAEAFKVWFDENVEEIIGVEDVVSSKDYGVAGRFDLLAKLSGREGYTMIDYKSGSKTRPPNWLQMAVYRDMHPEKANISGRMILHIRDGKVKEKWLKEDSLEQMDADVQMYLHILAVWKWKNKVV